MSQTATDHPFIIAGGGIGGLSLAVALSQKNIATTVIEKTDEFSEVGAGLQLSPNATRRLISWGLEDKLKPHATAPKALQIMDGVSRRLINKIPLTELSISRYNSPYWLLHRADLLDGLLQTAQASELISIHLSSGLREVEAVNGKIVATCDNGEKFEGCGLIGADGVWSNTRQILFDNTRARFSGYIAWRAMIEKDKAREIFAQDYTYLWLGPDSHLVHYPIKQGKYYNLVAVTKGEKLYAGWDHQLSPELLYEAFRPWHAPLRRALMEIEDWRTWPLMGVPPMNNWQQGKITLLGDAAHPVLPFLAQGAAMAIEDADCLANEISTHPNDVEAAFLAYQNLRLKRTRRIQQNSMKNGKFYHAKGALKVARNSALRMVFGENLLHRYNWLYKY